MQQATSSKSAIDLLGKPQGKIGSAAETDQVPCCGGALAILDVLHGDVFAAKGHIEALPIWQARTAVAELIATDREYDSAIAALKDLNREIEERGWLEVRFEELRQAGGRVVAAQERRRIALDRISPIEAEG